MSKETSHQPTIVFLYSELADYFLNAAKELAKEANVVIVRWPVNKEAPFQFNFDGLTVVQKDEINDLTAYVHGLNPSAVVVSGWMDRVYMKVAQSFKKKIPVVLTLDNHWKGTLKQHLLRILSPFKIHNIFNYVWVPGEKQKEYAKKLGFTKILSPFYVANTPLFEANYHKNEAQRTYENKEILYVGRYVEHKGVHELWSAFENIRQKFPDWTLKCVGTGDMWEQRKQLDGIQHLGFLQPEQLAQEVAKSSFVVIPSKFEPWGVVVQEMAISGMPLVVTDCVGAAHTFVSANNGVIIRTQELQKELESVLTQMMQLSTDQLKLMGQSSHQIGMKMTEEDWKQQILSVVK